MRELVDMVIQSARRRGDLWSRDWDLEPIPAKSLSINESIDPAVAFGPKILDSDDDASEVTEHSMGSVKVPLALQTASGKKKKRYLCVSRSSNTRGIFSASNHSLFFFQKSEDAGRVRGNRTDA